MVWGAFSRSQKLEIAFVSCRMDSEEYQTVLRCHVLPFLRRRRSRNYVFQQDNASVHASRSTKKWFQDNRISVTDWPACSPDLNPMENMWGILVRKVYMNNRKFRDVEELKAAVIEAWDHIDEDTMRNLVDSMPNRLYEVATKHGGPIDY